MVGRRGSWRASSTSLSPAGTAVVREELLDPALDGQQLSEPFFDSFGRPARAGPDRLARPVGVDGREVAVRLPSKRRFRITRTHQMADSSKSR